MSSSGGLDMEMSGKIQNNVPTTRKWYSGLTKPLAFVLVIVIFTAAFFGAIRSSSETQVQFSCLANGEPTFPWKTPTNILWDRNLFLSITLSFGDFTFGQAKLIDISWDLIVGRGGQLLLSIAIYPLMRRSLVAEMEKQPMHIPLVTAFCFSKVSWETGTAICKEMHNSPNKGRDRPGFVDGFSTWRLICFLASIIYVMAFGTFVSAMTGYQAQMESYCRSPANDGGDLLPLTNAKGLPSYSVDGSRIGIDRDFITGEMGSTYAAIKEYFDLYNMRCNNDPLGTAENGTFRQQFQPAVYINWVRAENGSALCTKSNITINNETQELQAPPLEIDKRSDRLDTWRIGNVTLNSTWIDQSDNTVCQPGSSYGWGFSSLLLFTFCIITLAFAIVLMTLQGEVWWHSQANKGKQEFSVYADILDLATMISDEFSSVEDDMNIKDFHRQIKTRTGEVFVSTDHLPPSRKQDWKEWRLRRRTLQDQWKDSAERSNISRMKSRMPTRRRKTAEALQIAEENSHEVDSTQSLLARPEPSASSFSDV